MDGMLMAALGSATLQTYTYTFSTTFEIPAGVTTLESLSGYGGTGAPAQSYVAPTFAQTSVRVVGLDYFPGNTGGLFEGNYGWAGLTSLATGARDAFNAGNDTTSSYVLTQYQSSGIYRYSFGSSTANPGVDVYNAQSITYSPNWLFSGDIAGGDYISAYADVVVNYYTSYGQPALAATTGADTTGFGKIFPGGVGGPASFTSFGPQTITPGPYTFVVPSGGSITFSFYA